MEKAVREVVKFGKYNGKPVKWVVLEKKEGKALLLCKNVLTELPFGAEKGVSLWEKSQIRKWLNEEFYNTAFSTEEKGKIIAKETEGDNVFVPDGEDIFIKYMDVPEDRVAKNLEGENSPWWIRLEKDRVGLDCSQIISDGSIVWTIGNAVKEYCGVRPSLQIVL